MVPDRPSHPSIAALERCLAFVDGFDGPMAAVWGDRDPVLGSVGKFVGRRLPRLRMVHTAAGHFLQEEVPAELAAAVHDVAARVLTSAA
jgi:haloalkane dehalogenase